MCAVFFEFLCVLVFVCVYLCVFVCVNKGDYVCVCVCVCMCESIYVSKDISQSNTFDTLYSLSIYSVLSHSFSHNFLFLSLSITEIFFSSPSPLLCPFLSPSSSCPSLLLSPFFPVSVLEAAHVFLPCQRRRTSASPSLRTAQVTYEI